MIGTQLPLTAIMEGTGALAVEAKTKRRRGTTQSPPERPPPPPLRYSQALILMSRISWYTTRPLKQEIVKGIAFLRDLTCFVIPQEYSFVNLCRVKTKVVPCAIMPKCKKLFIPVLVAKFA